jgi:hypothetical protein
VAGQLIRAEWLLAKFRDSRAPSGQIEVGEMARRVGHGLLRSG